MDKYYKERIEQLEQVCKKRLARIERLEKLCARMFRLLEMSANFPATVSGIEPTRREMQALGLIHETEYDPDTGLKWGEQNG